MKVGARNANVGRWPQKEPLREGARPKGPSPGSRGREEKPSQWGPLKMEEEEARDTEIFELEMKAEKLRDLLKKGENILSLEKFFFEFVETAATKISARMRLEDYRNCVYLGNVVQKITESVLMSFVSQKLHDEVYKDKKVLEIQNILGSISSVSRKPLVLSEYLKICYTGILNGKEFNPSRSFIEKTMVFLTLVLNNKAVMYFVRGQPMQGLIILLKTIQMRTRKCCSVVSCVQIAMMYINVAFLLTQVDKDEDALTFTNYSALLLEEMDPILQKEDTIDPFTKISMDYMHLLVRNFPDACGSLPHLERLTPSTGRSKFVYLLAEQYRSLALALQKNQKKRESEHAFGQAQILLKQAKKLLAIKRNDLRAKRDGGLGRRPSPENEEAPDPENVSYFSWGSDDSGPTDFAAFGNVSKEAIIFKQYA